MSRWEMDQNELAGPSMWDYDKVSCVCPECESRFDLSTDDPKIMQDQPMCPKCEAEARKEKYLCSQCNQTFWCDPGEVGEFGILCDGEEPICDECWEGITPGIDRGDLCIDRWKEGDL